MAWTMTDLEAIKAAIATGARRVRYKDHEVQYHSLEDMIRAKNMIQAEVENAGGGRPNRGGIKCANPVLRKGL